MYRINAVLHMLFFLVRGEEPPAHETSGLLIGGLIVHFKFLNKFSVFFGIPMHILECLVGLSNLV
jgi:hypothetical protein